MRLRLIAVGVTVLLAACSGEKSEKESSPPSPGPAAQELLAEIERTRPGVALQDFVRAAASGDERRLWERLSTPTRRRYGPTSARFRRSAAERLVRELESLGRRPQLILSQTITRTFAVAAVGRASRVFAAALRLEDGLWRLELGSTVRIKPLRPKPGEIVLRRTQVAAEVKAGAPIVEAGLWLDGLAFPSRGGGPTPNALTMFGETTSLARGRHSVIAFASTRRNASAFGWGFQAGG